MRNGIIAIFHSRAVRYRLAFILQNTVSYATSKTLRTLDDIKMRFRRNRKTRAVQLLVRNDS